MTTQTTEIYRRPRLLTPALFIRLYVLNCSSKELARFLNIAQAQISKYEASGVIPQRRRDGYRKFAAMQKKEIPEQWFVDVPVPPVPLINDHAMP